ncbi:hypothetical protein Ais01nite_24100 [Asanoa ishikariensis]|uniref:Uncharacterized protein n=1 Tax=Asanoa ishikariensis TaxID=137265 RepID=A0A1H3R872_9ACTN|nr:hypothetical protein [Asanoa ishikariensis]GIF64375.1 hypothetical protein Ais01nite_24100 [Asanoa ishikariensis]SDZ21159.1 hypothetical protein SAMN05421684_3509 [Asanoa ishikariensis]
MNPLIRRFSAAAGAVLALAVAVLVLPAPAVAAPLGQVTLDRTAGSVDDNPIFSTAAASAPCPTGFGADAMVRIGPPGGPYANVAKPLTAGGYDRKAVSVKPNRSFVMALGNVKPADGEWQVVVECYSVTEGMHKERFVTPITVSGGRWRTGRPAGGNPTPTTSAGADDQPPATPTASAPPDVSGSDQAAIDARLAANNRTGKASFGNAWWIAGLGGVLCVFGLVFLLTRPRPGKSR